MSGLVEKLGIDKLDLEQRLALIDEIWESIDAERMGGLLPSRAQIAEFEARMLEEALDDENDFDLEELEEIEDLFAPSKHH